MKKIERSEIACILTDKGNSIEPETFIAIVDENDNYNNGGIQQRINEKPFGYPLQGIEQWSIFIVTTEVVPGTMTCTVKEAEVSKYRDILSNEKLIHFLEGVYFEEEFNVSKIHERMIELRNKKIENIIDEKL